MFVKEVRYLKILFVTWIRLSHVNGEHFFIILQMYIKFICNIVNFYYPIKIATIFYHFYEQKTYIFFFVYSPCIFGTDGTHFNDIEASSQKLTHLTANRAKGPKKRPPSTVLTLNVCMLAWLLTSSLAQHAVDNMKYSIIMPTKFLFFGL